MTVMVVDDVGVCAHLGLSSVSFFVPCTTLTTFDLLPILGYVPLIYS